MIPSLLFLAAICGANPATDPVSQPASMAPRLADAARPAATLEEVYRAGRSWDSFYEAVDARQELWTRNWTSAVVPEELAARARAVGGPWRILVIAEARCSDSASSLPFLARLVEQTPGLEMRVVDSTVGRPWMEAHRSPDGRPATPTVLVLDDGYRIRGCWIEQPAKLQAFWLPAVARGTTAGEAERKLAWYAEDGGRETLRELVEVLESARDGRPICPGLS
jgi:hypothetical protein